MNHPLSSREWGQLPAGLRPPIICNSTYLLASRKRGRAIITKKSNKVKRSRPEKGRFSLDGGDGDGNCGPESDRALRSDFESFEVLVSESGDKAEARQGTDLNTADVSVWGAHREEDEPGLGATMEINDPLSVLRASAAPERAALPVALEGVVVTGRRGDINAHNAVGTPAGDVVSPGHIGEGAVDIGGDGDEFGLDAIEPGILRGEGASGAGDRGVKPGTFRGLFRGDGRESGIDFPVIAVKVLHQDTVAFIPEAELIMFGTIQEKNILSEAGASPMLPMGVKLHVRMQRRGENLVELPVVYLFIKGV